MTKSPLSVALVALGLVGCGAVYPQLETPVRSPPAHVTLAPPPPEDLLFLKFGSATIPSRTRDGRNWDSVGGSLPDAFAKLIVDGKVILETPVQSNSLTPTWPDQRRANYHVRMGATARVELWDSNPINNHPICTSDVPELHGESSSDVPVQINCNSGAEIKLIVEPAHGKLGVGLYYELRREEVVVTRVLMESPAARAGLVRGDQLLKIQGRDVKTMADGEAQSLINANAVTGVKLLVRKLLDKNEVEMTLKEGAIYPIYGEGVDIDG
ncbi:MAG TPA: PDZ domain-containing protein [Polyangiaceae bacterium]|nr:PDZ domain-containing protein [Polyangiaceae bacterium]